MECGRDLFGTEPNAVALAARDNLTTKFLVECGFPPTGVTVGNSSIRRYRARFCIPQRKEEHRSAPLLSKNFTSFREPALTKFLPGRRLDVNVYLLCATASKQPSSKRKEHY